jgi:hypothetical protein
MACQRCKTVINRFEHDGQVTYVHSHPWEEHDHEPEPVPAHTVPGLGLVCDFCGSLDVQFLYEGPITRVLLIDGHGEVGRQDTNSPIWSGCTGCHRYVIRGDLDGLLNHVRVSSTMVAMFGDDPAGVAAVVEEHRRKLWEAYIPEITRWSLVPPDPTPPFRLRPAVLPRVRDRLVKYLDSDLAHRVIRDAPLEFHPAPAALPGVCFDQDDAFAVTSHDRFADQPVRRFLAHIRTGLDGCQMYYVSKAFTHIAVTSARQITTISLDRREMPSITGFIAWEQPVGVIGADGLDAPVIAASWTLVPQGVWVLVYTRPEDIRPDKDREELRETFGYLYPLNPGGGGMFGQEAPKHSKATEVIAVIQATWRLMRQPGLAQETTEHAETRIRKQYSRAGRAEPNVRVISLRYRERRADAQPSSRTYTHGWAVGWDTGGFWRGYHVGPRDGGEIQMRWIAPYIARADLGFDDQDHAPKPTVRVLR